MDNKTYSIELAKIILPVAGAVIAWALSLKTININHHKEERKKLRRTLYYLLELRYRFLRELSLEKSIPKIIDMLLKVLKEKYHIEADGKEKGMVQTVLKQLIMQYVGEDENQSSLIKDADIAIRELSEWEPFFAYSLTGQHDIKGKLKIMHDFFAKYEETKLAAPLAVSSAVSSTVGAGLLNVLEESMRSIAQRIGRKASKELEEKIANRNVFEKIDKEDELQMTAMLDEMVQQMKDVA